MKHKLRTETFSQKTEHSGGVIVLPLTPLFSFVTFHLNSDLCEFTVVMLTLLSRASGWGRLAFAHSGVNAELQIQG